MDSTNWNGKIILILKDTNICGIIEGGIWKANFINPQRIIKSILKRVSGCLTQCYYCCNETQ